MSKQPNRTVVFDDNPSGKRGARLQIVRLDMADGRISYEVCTYDAYGDESGDRVIWLWPEDLAAIQKLDLNPATPPATAGERRTR